MSAKNRAELITKLHKVVKKQYQPINPPSNRSVMDHAIYACCLENSTAGEADEALAKLQENYFDWNEVRVTTDRELANTVKNLSDPMQAAERVKKILYGIFETYYQFDLEFLKKENLGKAVQAFEKMVGVTPFSIAYISQHGLGGHSIPTGKALLNLMVVAGIITEDEAVKGRVPGLERAIPKAKGIEFASLVHQLAVAFHKTPFSTAVRDVILKVDAGAKERFPKRGSKKKAAPPAAVSKTKTAAATAKAPAKSTKAVKAAKKKAPAKAPAKAAAKPVKKAVTKSAAKPKKKATKKTAASAKSKTTKATKAKKVPAKKTAKKKAAKKVTKKSSKKKPR